MISEQEVKHIAKLARLELSEVEIKKMQKDLSVILDYFDLLKKSPKVRPIITQSSLIKGYGATRKDEAIPQKREVVEKIIASAPDKKDDYIKVKAIF